jgi:hypothetical protein
LRSLLELHEPLEPVEQLKLLEPFLLPLLKLLKPLLLLKLPNPLFLPEPLL